MSTIYKILSAEDWAALNANKAFAGSDVDKADGYIHFSTAEQLAETLNKHYRGQGNLQVLTIETDLLHSSSLKWEPARGGALFPHLYSPLPLSAVTSSYAISAGSDGLFVLP